MTTEPAITANSIVAFISAVMVLLVSFGFDLTDAQQASIIGVVVIVAPLIAAFWTRKQSTPLIEPKDEDGTPLVRASSTLEGMGGAPTLSQMRAMGKR